MSTHWPTNCGKLFIQFISYHKCSGRILLLLDYLIQLATKSRICIGVSTTINRTADGEEFDKCVETLLSKENTRVSKQLQLQMKNSSHDLSVILFMDGDKAK